MKNIPAQFSFDPTPGGRASLPATPVANPISFGDCASLGRVVLDVDLPHLAIARALDRGDDPGIWREYKRSGDQEHFLEVLGALAGRYSTRQPHPRDPRRDTEWQHELIAVPFLLPPGSWPIATPSSPDRAGAGTLFEVLQRWAGPQQPVRIALDSARYMDLGRWSPLMQRQYLQLLARERQDLPARSDPIPNEWPAAMSQLSFAIASVRCWNSAPQLSGPGEFPGSSWELRSHMAACLGYSHQRAINPVNVLLPDRLREAVLAGLRMWLDELARGNSIDRWNLQPWGKDAMLLELGFRTPENGRAVLPLRLHQLGCGAELLVTELGDLLGEPSHGCCRAH